MQLSKYVNWASVTFVATLASVAVPVRLWFADLNSRSLAVNVISQTALTSDAAGSIKGLQVVFEGVTIDAPFLSVVRVTNDGKKPIAAADFEGPLEIRAGGKEKIVRADVTGTLPHDIEASLSWDSTSLRIAPLLLNPEDAITVSILTSGKSPTLAPRARIAGVSQVKLANDAAKPPSWRATLITLVSSILFFACSFVSDASFVGGPSYLIIRKRAALLLMMLCGSAGMVSFFAFFQAAGFDGSGWLVGLLVLVVMIAGVLGIALNWGASKLPKWQEVS